MLVLEIRHGRLFAAMSIGKSWNMAAYASADLKNVRLHTDAATGRSTVWVDCASFKLTPAELPRVEAWLARVSADAEARS